ncbi:MAG: hypothetical protein P8Y39_12895 [Nitrospirota bacterium]
MDRISMKRRTQRPIPSAPPRGINDVLLVFAGLGVYVTFVLWLHQAWFGVAPFG